MQNTVKSYSHKSAGTQPNTQSIRSKRWLSEMGLDALTSPSRGRT